MPFDCIVFRELQRACIVMIILGKINVIIKNNRRIPRGKQYTKKQTPRYIECGIC